ncbi:P1 family peptidase [Gelria sp. Kuro-4]|uniref:DmpA family aminopeptidase n=1 Tax=Gelria sp. Kuro-4 TaxID=2796927 RepID=UPI001BF03CF7|nr:P1 family peptidase [Gelria sp. Kuro-4]BCV25501.1 D-aminopeptidase [Gelria sp. Kuro-4]
MVCWGRRWAAVGVVVIMLVLPLVASAAPARPRARDVGIVTGVFKPGQYNAITDVKGVKVGHTALIEGEGKLVPGQGPVRTGVTAIIPHEGNLFQEKVPAAAFVLNAFGKSTGLQQVNELGTLEVPIVLTNTLNVPLVADAVIEWSLKQNPEIGIRTGTVNPVVGEVNDGFLNDIQGRHVRKEDVFQALENAHSGPVEEGAVGAGTGSSCMGWKGGIGTASRVLPAELGGYTVGVLVQTNFDGVLTVGGAPVGRELGRYSFSKYFPYSLPEPQDPGGSVMVVVATDAPLDQRQLERVAKRVGLGLARTGFYSSNGSGDFFIAFSTAQRIPHSSGLTIKSEVVSNDSMSALFLATVEATEEAVLNSLLKATTVVGRDGNTRDAIDIKELLQVLKKYNALDWDKKLPPWGNGQK